MDISNVVSNVSFSFACMCVGIQALSGNGKKGGVDFYCLLDMLDSVFVDTWAKDLIISPDKHNFFQPDTN